MKQIKTLSVLCLNVICKMKGCFLVGFKGIAIVQSLSHVRLCDPMDCSKLGFPVLHLLLEFAQTRVH